MQNHVKGSYKTQNNEKFIFLALLDSQRCVPTFLVKAASVVGNVVFENTSVANTSSIITPAGNFGNATTLEAALSGYVTPILIIAAYFLSPDAVSVVFMLCP